LKSFARIPEMQTEKLFLSNLARIERLIRSTCRRHHFIDAEAEEFESVVKLKFVEGDYAILQQYEGRSSLSTYLYIAIERLFLGHRDHLWGRWRPSAEAKRLGEVAMNLERLTSRDRLTMAEAIESVSAARDASWRRGMAEHLAIQKRLGDLSRGSDGRAFAEREMSRTEIERIALQLPLRTPRTRQDGGDDVLRLVQSDSKPDGALFDCERGKHARLVDEALQDTLHSLDAIDQLILRMRFIDSLKIVTIATSLRIDQKLLYKRLDRLLGILRRSLLEKGLAESDIRKLIEHGAEGVAVRFSEEKGNSMTRPSHLVAQGIPNGESRPE